ncbi:MAG: hypothetical protein NUW23_06310, partial [Firmicutes bacterium]|nr:hypothetical protein [Bacillota bacterium]
ALTTRSSVTHSTVFVGDLLIPWDDTSSMGHAGVGDFWVNPSVFKEILKIPRYPLTTVQVSYEANGRVYEAYRFDYDSAEDGRRYIWVVDPESGLMLYHAQWSPTSDRNLCHVSVMELVTTRQLLVPWAGSSVPSSFKAGMQMTYQGHIKTWLPATGPNIPVPAVLEVVFTNVGHNWTEARVQRVFSGQPADAALTVHTGPGLLAGGFWIPPAWLARLRNGDRLDEYDPITKSQVEVSYVGTTTTGVPIVAIFEWGKRYKRVWVYRMTDGLLVYWLDEKLIDPASGMIQQAEWQLR